MRPHIIPYPSTIERLGFRWELSSGVVVGMGWYIYVVAHIFRRSTSPVRSVGAVGEFPDTCVATELIHGLRKEFPLHFPLLCSLLPSLFSTLRA